MSVWLVINPHLNISTTGLSTAFQCQSDTTHLLIWDGTIGNCKQPITHVITYNNSSQSAIQRHTTIGYTGIHWDTNPNLGRTKQP